MAPVLEDSLAYTTDQFEGMVAETITVKGANGDAINAYFARPMGAGPFPTVVLAHHMPGWSNYYKEQTRTFAANGYIAICPDLYHRNGSGTPEAVAGRVREAGGVPDAQVVADLAGARDFVKSLPSSNGKVGVIGSCSGGRHAYLAATAGGYDAVVDLWGGGVVMAEADLTPNRPVSPVDYTKDLSCPILGLFGLEDRAPTAEQVDIHEAELKKHGKDYEFHRYEGAGHGFMYYHTQLYRQPAAADAWQKIWAFFGDKLS